MRVSALFGSFLVLAFSSVASGVSGALKLRQRIASPRNWVDLGRAPPTYAIPLRIAFPQSRYSELEQHLAEISDPFHARYGKHLSKEDVEELVAPHASSVDAVHEWLESHGVPKEACHQSPAGDWVSMRLPVAQAEKMLGTEFHMWKHAHDGDVLVRATEYSLPAHLDEHIELIQPTTIFNRAKGQSITSHFSPDPDTANSCPSDDKIYVPGSGVTVDASCSTNITVTCLKQLYNAAHYVPRAAHNNSIALTGYVEQFPNFSDLQQFYADQVPAAINTSFNVVLINGGLNNQTLSAAGAEANIDVQIALGISFPTPGTFYSTGGEPPYKPDVNTVNNTNEPYLDWLDFVRAQHEIPRVISTSYGDDEQSVPLDYARRLCEEFAQLGTRGVSLIFASGDGGVGGGPGGNPVTQTCFTNDGKNQTKFLPIFPASCPFVTTVGGTVHIPEVAYNFSGGGFSNYFPRPSWQDAAVNKFLESLPSGTYDGLFNPMGRAYPDISAHAEFFKIFHRGRAAYFGGTSAAAPSVAGLVALLNDARIAAGKSPLGFLNPLIYALNGEGFTDITSGNAPGCGTPGFNVTVGWDPVTGFGTPNFEKLKELALRN